MEEELVMRDKTDEGQKQGDSGGLNSSLWIMTSVISHFQVKNSGML